MLTQNQKKEREILLEKIKKTKDEYKEKRKKIQATYATELEDLKQDYNDNRMKIQATYDTTLEELKDEYNDTLTSLETELTTLMEAQREENATIRANTVKAHDEAVRARQELIAEKQRQDRINELKDLMAYADTLITTTSDKIDWAEEIMSFVDINIDLRDHWYDGSKYQYTFERFEKDVNRVLQGHMTKTSLKAWVTSLVDAYVPPEPEEEKYLYQDEITSREQDIINTSPDHKLSDIYLRIKDYAVVMGQTDVLWACIEYPDELLDNIKHYDERRRPLHL